jgi:hypothetical protein
LVRLSFFSSRFFRRFLSEIDGDHNSLKKQEQQKHNEIIKGKKLFPPGVGMKNPENPKISKICASFLAQELCQNSHKKITHF